MDLSTSKATQGDWLDYLQTLGAVGTTTNVNNFGSLQKEYQALKKNAVLVPLLSNTPLKITGKDSLDFLHGQVSNKVKGLKEGEHNTSLMLNFKGHALAQMRVFKRAEDLFVVVESGLGEIVKKQLNAHIIFDQVEIEDLSNTLVSLTLLGNNAIQILQKLFSNLPSENNFIYIPLNGAKVLINSARRALYPAFDLHILKKDAIDLANLLLEVDATFAGEELLNIARVEAGIPNAAYEGGEGVLPQEIGLEEAISYNKGCYLGQEIMARIEARGNVHKELSILSFEKSPASNEKSIVANGKSVGKISTLINHPEKGFMALASLRKDVKGDLNVANKAAKLCNLPT